jgi:hypothetical protein
MLLLGIHCCMQLWGAIALGDMTTAREAATLLAGERGGRILPEILRPRNWAKATPEERQRVRRPHRLWGSRRSSAAQRASRCAL